MALGRGARRAHARQHDALRGRLPAGAAGVPVDPLGDRRHVRGQPLHVEPVRVPRHPDRARPARRAAPRRRDGRAAPEEGIRFEDVGFRYPGKETWALRGARPLHPARAEPRARRPERRRQDDVHQAADAPLRADRGAHPARRQRPARLGPRGALRRRIGVVFQDFNQYQLNAARERRRRQRRAPRGRARASSAPSSAAAPTEVVGGAAARARRRSSAAGSRTASSSPAGSGRRSRSRAPSCARRPTSWSSTSRPRRSTPRPSTPSSSASAASREGRTTHPHLAPLPDGAHGRSHPRARGRQDRRGGHTRRLVANGGRYAQLFSLQAQGYL